LVVPPLVLPPLVLPLLVLPPLLLEVPASSPGGMKSVVLPAPASAPAPAGGQFGLKSPPLLHVNVVSAWTSVLVHSRREPKGTSTLPHVQAGPPLLVSCE